MQTTGENHASSALVPAAFAGFGDDRRGSVGEAALAVINAEYEEAMRRRRSAAIVVWILASLLGARWASSRSMLLHEEEFFFHDILLAAQTQKTIMHVGTTVTRQDIALGQ